MAAVLAASLAGSPARATAADDEPAAKKTAPADQGENSKPSLPDPEFPVLTTSDELDVKATYFPGADGQDSIPVIIIHGLGPKSNRRDYDDKDSGLARFLQATLGCAVIVPDLRGHGDSTKWSEALQKRLREEHKRPREALKVEKFKPADYAAMLDEDLRAVKDFLWKQNNEHKLNLDKLTVIGVEEGAALALCYAAADANGYEQHQAKRGPLKLGNFVKAVVLISPQTKVAGLNTATAKVLHDPDFRDLRLNLPIMILAGDENPAYFKEAETLHNEFQKGRPKPDSKQSKPEDWTLWFYGKGRTSTKLQGAQLLAEPSMKVVLERIQTFIKARLVDNPDAKEWVWKERKKPYE
jgi:pimeloyl-ACP methyl ester carboxylesterase